MGEGVGGGGDGLVAPVVFGCALKGSTGPAPLIPKFPLGKGDPDGGLLVGSTNGSPIINEPEEGPFAIKFGDVPGAGAGPGAGVAVEF